MNYDVFIASSTDASTDENTASVSDDTIADIYKRIDNMDKNINELMLMSSRKSDLASAGTRQSTSNEATPTDVYLASITDACQDISINTYNTYSWVVILSFLIVIFEFKKLVRGAIKKYYTKE